VWSLITSFSPSPPSFGCNVVRPYPLCPSGHDLRGKGFESVLRSSSDASDAHNNLPRTASLLTSAAQRAASPPADAMAFARPLQQVDENTAQAKEKAVAGKPAQPQVAGRR